MTTSINNLLRQRDDESTKHKLANSVGDHLERFTLSTDVKLNWNPIQFYSKHSTPMCSSLDTSRHELYQFYSIYSNYGDDLEKTPLTRALIKNSPYNYRRQRTLERLSVSTYLLISHGLEPTIFPMKQITKLRA